MGCLDPNTTISIYFEVCASEDAPVTASYRPLQLVTTYIHPTGSMRVRVTTVLRPWHSDTQNMLPIARSFDQEAAAVIIARLATFRIQDEVYAQ